MATTLVKGKDLMIFKKSGSTYTAFAHATNHTLSASRDMLETSSKDTGIWGDNEPGKISWSMTTECLYTEVDFDTLMKALISGEKLIVVFTVASNASTSTVPAGGWLPNTGGWEGEVVISAVDANAANGDNASYTATLTGAGELKARSGVSGASGFSIKPETTESTEA